MSHIYDLLAAFANWSMAHVQNQLALANCNLHFCIYGAFGATLLLRAFLFRPVHNPDETRENFVHGMVYLCLGLLK